MKPNQRDYEQVPMLEPLDDDPVLPMNFGSERHRTTKDYIAQQWRPLVCHLVLVLLYSLISFMAIVEWRTPPAQETPRGYYAAHSPAQSAVRYKSYVFNAAPNLTSPYVGESRPQLDKAWHELLQHTNMRVSKEDLERVNRTSIPLGNGGGFYGEMAVFHELHCLKFLRQAFHMDYYGDRFGDIEKETMGEHTEHCIELLRQGVMCRGDPTLITFRWGHTVKLPQPDFTLQHECVDWEYLMEWATGHSINVFEDGMLVHPTLGPSYPGGYREDRPHPPSDSEHTPDIK
ncbi:MAG: hypothetical protein M1821_002494 [Bathelium mastoideum]|nr:MAG: hypothetical protein M1821_002494 [Bathelium mastoideum]